MFNHILFVRPFVSNLIDKVVETEQRRGTVPFISFGSVRHVTTSGRGTSAALASHITYTFHWTNKNLFMVWTYCRVWQYAFKASSKNVSVSLTFPTSASQCIASAAWTQSREPAGCWRSCSPPYWKWSHSHQEGIFETWWEAMVKQQCSQNQPHMVGKYPWMLPHFVYTIWVGQTVYAQMPRVRRWTYYTCTCPY